MNIELEDNSAPPFVKFLNERDIEAVAFDIDNTLVATNIYYHNAWDLISRDIVTHLNISKSPEIVAEEYKNVVKERYSRRDMKPENVLDEALGGLKEYLGYITDDMREIVSNHLKDFYNFSPNPYDSAYEILKVLNDSGKKFVFCSHAQDNWTKVKVSLLGKELEDEIPYVAVDIVKEKDPESWIEATNLISVDISKTLVVGDSLEADIQSSIKAGCKYVVWIDRHNTGLPEGTSIPEDVKLFIIKDISLLLSLED